MPAADAGSADAGAGSAVRPQLPPTASDKILVSERQRGNKVIECIRNVGWEYATIVPDYQLGQATVALFLSLRYHLLHPQYILRRVEELNRGFTLCVILVLVDMEDHQRPIQEITRAMLVNRCTVVLAWSSLEAARYLETLKAYQSKPVDMLQQKPTGDYTATLHDCLSAIRAINKSDVLTLSTSLGSLREILLASEEQLALCPGLGEKKIRLLQAAATDPFMPPGHAARGAPVEPEPAPARPAAPRS
ncbi:restriction endonuclease type II-like protein [Pavlovales sp. CCMP2436]|nr:restriction endonuclease type II-like protein [Pavlovales sp. CCMP2436]